MEYFSEVVRTSGTRELSDVAVVEASDDWPGPAWRAVLSPEAKAGLGLWMRLCVPTYSLSRPRVRIETAGSDARATLAEPFLGLREYRLRLVDGVWKVVLPLTRAFMKSAIEGDALPANDAAALRALMSIATAQADFRHNDRDRDRIAAYWTGDVAGLYALDDIRLIDPEVSAADAAPLPAHDRNAGKGPVARSGYLFRTMTDDAAGAPYQQDLNKDGAATENRTSYGVCTWPVEYPKSGRYTFIVNQDNVIWKRDTGGQVVLQFPKDPKAEGWTKGE